ncbi:alpha/beta hydrolase family protein [Streptomyces scopuliridis]|uniref:alpha/beta hydrolase family protein n=1 Tax=Streptomyces scopuliridis TaxID=452529 RepID=UPI00367BB9F2
MTTTAKGDVELSRRNRSRGTMRAVAVFDGQDHPLGPYPVQITPDGTGAWVGSNRGTDRTRWIRVVPRTCEETEVDSHSVHDLDTRAQDSPDHPSPLIRRRWSGELLGARYLGERQVIHALGLPLPAYLTLPVGVEPVGLPVVLLVHGGPWRRDHLAFRSRRQLLSLH